MFAFSGGDLFDRDGDPILNGWVVTSVPSGTSGGVRNLGSDRPTEEGGSHIDSPKRMGGYFHTRLPAGGSRPAVARRAPEAGDPHIGSSDPRSPLGSYTLTETQRQSSRLFRAYITKTHACKILIRGKISVNGKYEEIDQEREYLHRWTPAYRKAIVSKFYQLQEWWEKNPSPITLLTLTTYQDLKYRQNDDSPRLSIEEGFTTLKKGWRWLSVWLRKYYPNIEYVHIMEPHRSGYPHLHVVLFGGLPKSSQEDIRRLWSEKYELAHMTTVLIFRYGARTKGLSQFVIT